MIGRVSTSGRIMATKADLESELAALRKELAALKDTARDAAPPTDDADGAHSIPGDILAAIKGTDIEGLAKQLTNEIETSMHEKPLLTALGILVVGYALGRIR
jgi:hypothetical protein